MKHLAIDIGSTRIKAALIDPESQSVTLLQQHATPYLPSPDPLCCTGDAQEIYHIVRTLLQTFISAAPGERCTLRLSTQMHGFVLAQPDGTPLTPYISWQDNRCLHPSPTGERWLDLLQARLTPVRMQRCGLYLKPSLALCNAYALLQRKDYEIPADSLFCTLGSYLTLRLTGENACHPSSAAPTGFYSVSDGTWDPGLISLLGRPDLRFPTVLSEHTPCGQLRVGEHTVLVYPDVGDQQMAVLGSMPQPERDVILNLATAGQLARISGSFSTGDYEIRPYFEGLYLNTVTRLPAGRNLDVLIRFLQACGRDLFGISCTTADLYQRLTPLIQGAEHPPQVHMGFFPDALDGMDGAICDIDSGNFTPGNLFYGAYRSIGTTYLHHLRLLEGNCPPERLVLTGGALQNNPLLCDVITRILGLPYQLAPCRDEVMLGHFRLCLVDSGYCPDLEETGCLNRLHFAAYE